MILTTFSCVCCPSLCLLSKNVYSGLLSILKIILHFNNKKVVTGIKKKEFIIQALFLPNWLGEVESRVADVACCGGNKDELLLGETASYSNS